jgi:hypothetical protein
LLQKTIFHKNLMRFIFFAICYFSLQVISGQTPNVQWARQLGGTSCINQGLSTAVDQLGNIYTTGSFSGITDFDPGVSSYTLSSNGGEDVFISKLDAAGNFIWVRQFGGTSDDFGTAIFVDALNNVFTTGTFYYTADFDPGAGTYTFTSPGQDIFISKLDPSGNFVWARQIGGVTWDEYAKAINVDASGNVLTTGFFSSLADFDPGPGTYTMTVPVSWQADAFISKLDSSGNFVWAKQIDGPGDIAGHSIRTDASGNVYSTGVFQATADFDPGPGTYTLNGSATGIKDIYISKLDASGNFVWAKQMVGTGYDQGYSMKLDASGNIYSTGFFEGIDDFDPGVGTFTLTSSGGYDAYVSKLDSMGNFVWAKQLGGISYDIAHSLDLDASGNVYTSGEFRGLADFDPGVGTFTLNSSGRTDVFISKLNSSGNFVWAIQMGDTAFDVANSIAVDVNANVYTTGSFQYMVDFDPSPNTLTLTTLGTIDAFVHKICQGCSTRIPEDVSQGHVNIFPNPTNGRFNLYADRTKEIRNIKVFNIRGQIILEKTNLFLEEISIDISEYASGMYLVEVQTADGVSMTKLIKS